MDDQADAGRDIAELLAITRQRFGKLLRQDAVGKPASGGLTR
jgi:hypothetical protein